MAELILDVVVGDEIEVSVADPGVIEVSPALGELTTIVQLGPQGLITSSLILDATQIGRDLLTAVDAAAARDAIGAGSGASWFFGDGVPTTVAAAKSGDIYMDLLDGSIYVLGEG